MTEDPISRAALLRAAGSKVFERGQAYADEGLVLSAVRSVDGVIGVIGGTRLYQAHLHTSAAGALPTGTCSCPHDAFCKHLVALALVAGMDEAPCSDPNDSLPYPDLSVETRTYLAGRTKNDLVALIAAMARESKHVREQLRTELTVNCPPDQYPEKLGGALMPHKVVLPWYELSEAEQTKWFSDNDPYDDEDYYGRYYEPEEPEPPATAETLRCDIRTANALVARIETLPAGEETMLLIEASLEEAADAWNAGADQLTLKRLMLRLEAAHLKAAPALPASEIAELAVRLLHTSLEQAAGTRIFGAFDTTYAPVFGEPWREAVVEAVLDAGAPDTMFDTYREPAARHLMLELAIRWLELDEAIMWARLAHEYAGFDEEIARRYSQLVRERGTPQQAYEVDRAAFASFPHVASYKRLKKSAEAAGEWASIDSQSLDQLMGGLGRLRDYSQDLHFAVSELLAQGRDDEALAIVRNSRFSGWEKTKWMVHDARAAAHPDETKNAYLNMIDQLAQRGSRGRAYDYAAGLVERASRAYAKAGQPEVFDALLRTVVSRHGRKYGLMNLVENKLGYSVR